MELNRIIKSEIRKENDDEHQSIIRRKMWKAGRPVHQ
jgi:hypothetical protein